MKIISALLLAVGLLTPMAPEPNHTEIRGYYQSPTLHGSTLVFSSEGDLWRVPLGGGVATRLTAHPTLESEPHLSPDGSLLAFTGRYDGVPAVYVMPMTGGAPRRITFGSGAAQVQGWTRNGEVLYASNGGVGPVWSWHLRTIHPGTLEEGEFPLTDARQGTFDEAGTLYFTRFGLDVTGDNARAYRGGAMAELWRFTPGMDEEAERVAADHPGNLTRPMWWNGRLYLVSDADGLYNLWRLDPMTGVTEPLTTHGDFEVRGATLSEGRIVYQHGADLRVYEIESGADRALDIVLASDRGRTRERWLEAPLDFLNSANLAPAGDRAALTARGRVAVAGTGSVRRVEIPLPHAGRAREAILGHDGRWVYAFVDTAGEQEIWRFSADGSGEGEALTRNGDTQRLRMYLSPDGRFIAHDDRRHRLWLLDLEDGTNTLLDAGPSAGYQSVVWSPDGGALAFVRFDTPMRRPQLLLHHLDSGETRALTSDRYESRWPAFSPDGRWLYFLSDRHFVATPGSPWGDRNLGPVFDGRTEIYALALQPGNTFPLAPRTELTQPGNQAPEGAGEANVPGIVMEGLEDRLFQVPVPPGNYTNLLATGDRLYLLERTGGDDPQPLLRRIDFGTERPRVVTVAPGISSAALSVDGRRMMVRRGRDLFIVPTGPQLPGELNEARIRVDGWRLPIDPPEEWQQMFVDGWRMQRDFLFDPQMRGLDWDAVREKYGPLVDRVGDRRELDDVFSQMVAELGVLHSQVRGGEYPDDPETARPAFLGGQFEPAHPGLRITHIYRTDPELPQHRSPLVRPGVDLRVGDLLRAVNGRPVDDLQALARALSHQAGEQVRLDVERDGTSFQVVATPVAAAQDANFRYLDWVTGRREAVEEASGGRLGYVHIRAMGAANMADFVREFYANIDRDGVIIDVRRNTGGNIDSWIIDRLLRRAWSFWQPPGQDPYWNMQQAFRGHVAVLADPLTYSDGETFSAGVKALELGPVIGRRTAGAGVWLSDTNRLVDQGVMRAAQSPQFGEDGRWLIEGFGVEPTIEVDNLPHATWKGEDAQLERAIRELLRTLETHPVEQPPAEAIPPHPQVGRDVPP